MTSTADQDDRSTDGPLRVSHRGGIVRATIANPPLNLLDGALMLALDGLAAGLEGDADARVLVLDSADPDFFVPHGDMAIVDDPAVFATLPVATAVSTTWNPMMRLHERIRALPQITIGVLRGKAGGGGAELFTALDLRYAALETAELAQMEAPTGIIPGAGGTAYLPRILGRSRALEVVLGARRIDAATLERWGWVTRALPAAELDAFVDRLAADIAALAPGVARAAVAAVDAGEGSFQRALDAEDELLGQLFEQPAAAALTRAALELGAQTREGERELETRLHEPARGMP